MTSLVALENYELRSNEPLRDFVTIYLGDQMFGIPVLKVQDVLRPQKIANVPLAQREVAGLLNLRGRIVTAINLRHRIGVHNDTPASQCSNVVIEHQGELYSLLIDKIGDVLSLPAQDFEKNPANLEPRLKEVASGIYRLKTGLMMVLDVEKILSFEG